MYSEVKNCEVRGCFYNRSGSCTAAGITIGSPTPKCETAMMSERQHSGKMNSALVGACHVGECKHNQDFFCHAVEDIEVRMQEKIPMCVTYST